MESIRSLIPIVALSSTLAVLTVVMVFIGFPWAGVGSSLACAAGTTALTLGLAFVFTHGPEGHRS